MQIWSVESCLRRLRELKAECESKRSALPVEQFFKELHDKLKAEPGDIADKNHLRIQNLWSAHFDEWYVREKESEEKRNTG